MRLGHWVLVDDARDEAYEAYEVPQPELVR